MNKQWILAGVIAVVLVIGGFVVYASQNGGVIHLPGGFPGQSYTATVTVNVQRYWSGLLEGVTSFRVNITNVSYDYGLMILPETPPLAFEAQVKIVLTSYDSKGVSIDSVQKLVTLGFPVNIWSSTSESYTMTVKLGNQRAGRTITAVLYPPDSTTIITQTSTTTS